VEPERLLAHRTPFEAMEAAAIRGMLARPGDLSEATLDTLRYVLSFAKMHAVRREDGTDAEVAGFLASHAWRVRTTLEPALLRDGDLRAVAGLLAPLVEATRSQRAALAEHAAIDPHTLDAEVRERPFVVVCGGGGGAGYGYAGAWRHFHRQGFQPALIAGTSIGALMGMFRARRKVYDAAPLFEASKRLSYETVFRVLQVDSRYGLPATLRLYLRAAIGALFQDPDGRPLTFRELEIPLLVCCTGIGLEALKHDLAYYEHFLDDAIAPGARVKASRVDQVVQVVGLVRELLSTPEALREVVFGQDPATLDADIVDAAGFSASIPGLIHYDVVRDDRRMKLLLDELYARYGITRLAEGGLVNNVPARPAWEEVVVNGRVGRRNAYVVALDCFAPRLRSGLFLAIQQIVKPNVLRNLPYAHLHVALNKTLSPVNLVPTADDVVQAMQWTTDELTPLTPLIARSLAPVRPL
jgi:predicted acylesterase/phospholipase RssA